MFKEELWMRRTIAKVTMLKRKTTTDKQEILEEIRRNGTKEQEVIQALEKDDGLTWEEDGIVYMEERMYVPNSKKLKEKILQKKSQLSGCGTSRTTENARTDQMKLLVARTKRRHQKICTRMFQMSTKQSPASEEVRRTIPIGDPTRIMAGD